MSRVITLRAFESNLDTFGNIPTPSSKFLPDWYKAIPPFIEGANKLKFPNGHGWEIKT